jgi:hypothetical protein
MDAKTLRAALSAAIRVTVSTSLIGCGGNVTTTTGSEPTTDVEAPATSYPSPMLDHDSDYPAIGGSAAGKASIGGAGGGTGPAGQGGSEQAAGSAGAPATNRCELVDPCLTLLEGLNLTFSDPLPSTAAKECCALALDVIGDFAATECGQMDEMWWKRRSRFMLAGAHSACCTELSAWSNSACTPWGPPVPPELSLEALLVWEAAA